MKVGFNYIDIIGFVLTGLILSYFSKSNVLAYTLWNFYMIGVGLIAMTMLVFTAFGILEITRDNQKK